MDALTTPQYTLKVEKQPVSCEIERSAEKYPIKMTLAPELKFKDGKATNASLHVDNIEGTTIIKGVVWTAATLEQNFGLFESDLVREVNKFIEKQCPKRMAQEKWDPQSEVKKEGGSDPPFIQIAFPNDLFYAVLLPQRRPERKMLLDMLCYSTFARQGCGR